MPKKAATIAATDTNNTNTNNSATKNKSGVVESNEKATISSSDDDDKKMIEVGDKSYSPKDFRECLAGLTNFDGGEVIKACKLPKLHVVIEHFPQRIVIRHFLVFDFFLE